MQLTQSPSHVITEPHPRIFELLHKRNVHNCFVFVISLLLLSIHTGKHEHATFICLPNPRPFPIEDYSNVPASPRTSAIKEYTC